METESYEIVGRYLIIFLSGDLDHHVAERIRGRADKLIEQHQIRHVIFDFSKTGFMDSSGIGVILGRYQKVRYYGGTVSVAGVEGRVGKIFRMAGLGRIVRQYRQIEDILERG